MDFRQSVIKKLNPSRTKNEPDTAQDSSDSEGAACDGICEHWNQLKKTRLILTMINMFFFAISVLLFVVGILYVTGFKYEYTFTRYSTSLMAGFFIALSIIQFILSAFNVIFVQKDNNKHFFTLSSIIMGLYAVLFGMGIWGLVITGDQDYLKYEVETDMIYSIRNYFQGEPDKYETIKMDWLQRNFNCCGINDWTDWQSLNGNNRIVPDSCCINPQFCPKPINIQNINTKGCLYTFLFKLQKDLKFLAGLSFGVSLFGMILWLVVLLLFLFKRRLH